MAANPWEIDRPRGILTKADRRYLKGESEIEPQSHGERKARERIRKRLKNSILDFVILFKHLEPRDRNLIFEPDLRGKASKAEIQTDISDDDLQEGVTKGLAFMLECAGAYELLEDVHTETVGTNVKGKHTPFVNQVVEDAVFEIGRKFEYSVENVTINVEAKYAPIQDTIRRLEGADAIPSSHVRLLLESDVVDRDRLREFLKSQIQDVD